MKYLLDTDHLSILQAPERAEQGPLIGRLPRDEWHEVAVSIICFHEQVLGANAYISRANNVSGLVRGYRLLGSIIEDFSKMTVLLFDAKSAKVFDNLRSQRIRVATIDLRIASIALTRGLVLLTRDTRDFGRIPGLVTEDWTLRDRGNGDGAGRGGP